MPPSLPVIVARAVQRDGGAGGGDGIPVAVGRVSEQGVGIAYERRVFVGAGGVNVVCVAVECAAGNGGFITGSGGFIAGNRDFVAGNGGFIAGNGGCIAERYVRGRLLFPP